MSHVGDVAEGRGNAMKALRGNVGSGGFTYEDKIKY